MLIHLLVAALSEPLGAPSTVSLSDYTSIGNSGQTAGVMFGNNGEFYSYEVGIPIVLYNWLSPVANVGDYEIRATVSSGSTPDTGTIGSWEALSTARQWTLTNSTPSTTDTSELLIEIRWTGDNEVKDSATYTLRARGP